MVKYLWVLSLVLFSEALFAQDMTSLVLKVKAKLEQVNDYEADGRMKTDVSFIKAPIGKVKVYFKKPNKFRLKKDGGISLLPKGGVSVNMNSVFATTDFVALAAGESMIDGAKTKIVKLLPNNENGDIILTTLYIDELNDYSALQDKKIVGIDPGKEDLIYCVDDASKNANIFRYSQNQRRKETKMKKIQQYHFSYENK